LSERLRAGAVAPACFDGHREGAVRSAFGRSWRRYRFDAGDSRAGRADQLDRANVGNAQCADGGKSRCNGCTACNHRAMLAAVRHRSFVRTARHGHIVCHVSVGRHVQDVRRQDVRRYVVRRHDVRRHVVTRHVHDVGSARSGRGRTRHAPQGGGNQAQDGQDRKRSSDEG
jgi:hypothetical protein